MRGKILALTVGTVLLTAALLSAQAGAGKKGHSCSMKGGGCCPMAVEGADVQLANVANGVTITITAKDPEAVKKIQENAAKHVKDGKFVCDCKGGKKGKKCADGTDCDKKGEKKDKKDEKKAEEKKPEGQK